MSQQPIKRRLMKRREINWRYVQPSKVDDYAGRGWKEATPQPENKFYVLMIWEPVG